MQESTTASGEYLRNAVMTATPEQLHLMLYDGAIRFVQQAKDALTSRDLETSCEKLIRAQRIIVELQRGLRPEYNPDLCQQLEGLYAFVYNRLVDANITHDPIALDESLQILTHQRETWRLLINRVKSVPTDSVTQFAGDKSTESLPRPTISLQC